MARRKIPTHKHSRPAGISLPPDLIREARKAAFQKGMSLSMFVRLLLMERVQGAAQ